MGSGSRTKATSVTLLARPAVGSSQLISRRVTEAAGCSAVNRDLIAGSIPPRTGLLLIPTRRVARCWLLACSAACHASSHAASTRRACGSSAAPTGVRATSRWPRSNNSAPSCRSSILICLLKAGWER